MARSIEHSWTLPAAPLAVRRTLVDTDFVAAKLAATGGRGGEILHASADEVRISHAIAAEKLPSAVRTLIGGDLVIERTELWQGDATADVRVRVPRGPGELSATLQLDAAEQGCIQKLSGQIRVAIPLLGGKIEESIAAQLGKLLDREAEFTRQWLAQH